MRSLDNDHQNLNEFNTLAKCDDTRSHLLACLYSLHAYKSAAKSSDSSERFDDTAIQLTARHPANNYFTRTQQDASLCVTLHLFIAVCTVHTTYKTETVIRGSYP